ncbi:putative minor capsid protein [Companilactobacillus mishanensis]|uniref:Capsid protein n=1 Tax=Companilactobacillus mishanensis TaxID=2486008 RepID=A0A5P0ZF25_9LACO|nr:putative minor capsid protein [Companilactobacillus mishanensis]MQS44246.1 capsid protein [Companilactobacillus mishanensis]MQS51650.1 capsid protein [Companilactobacillus mishanensis]
MRLPQVPKSMANQEVTLHLKSQETDDWGKPKYEDVKITHCVVQPQTVFSGSNNDRQIVANAIVFFYAQITTPMPTLDRDSVGSTITFDKHEYTITQIVDNRDPFGNEVWSYELEVL